jgi:hypothetical protein
MFSTRWAGTPIAELTLGNISTLVGKPKKHQKRTRMYAKFGARQ